MIKINLLATPYINKKAFTLETALVATLFLLVATFFHGIYEECSNRIELILKNNIELKEEIKRLTLESEPIQELKQKNDSLQERLKLIADIQASKVGIAKVLQEVNESLPKEVWLINFKVKDENLELLGRALNDDAVLLFVKQLENSKYFKNIELKFSDSIFYDKKKQTITKDLNNDIKEKRNTGVKNWQIQDTYKYDESDKKISVKEEGNIVLKEVIITGQIFFQKRE